MRVECLSEAQLSILDAIIAGELAWRTVEQLGRDLRRDPEGLLDDLADLEAGGWIRSWPEWPRGVSISLTPVAAFALEVRIVEVGSNEQPRWARLDEPDPFPPRAKRLFQGDKILALCVDPSPGPAELVELAEMEPVPQLSPFEENARRLWADRRRELHRNEDAKRRRKEARKAKRRQSRCSG